VKEDKTLYERLGGEAAINAVVDKFYEFMLVDPVTAPFFDKTDMKKQASRQKQFITMVTGGPNKYEGADMKTAHLKFKIGKKEFDETWHNLVKSLNFFKVSQSNIDELKTVFYSVYDDVVNVKEDKTLYERLGGEAAINAVVDKFYEFMLVDPVTAPFFDKTDMKKQASRQKQFITMVTGGPNKYEGADMKTAHLKFKIGKKEFDETWHNLVKSLNFFKVSQSNIDELKTVFYSVYDDVVNVKEDKTLYERLGGEAAINAVVDKFYEFMLVDPVTAPFFDKTDMKKQVSRQKQFITMVTGGPNKYEGADMKTAHLKFKIGKKEFDETWHNLVKSLNFFKVSQSNIDELKTVFYSV
jgi:hemoglobin